MKRRLPRNRRRLTAAVTISVLAVVSPGQAGAPGDFSVQTRLRFETAEIDGLEDADNASLRLRLEYTTPECRGLRILVGGEFTGVADEGSYNAAGVHGDPAKAVIADPKNVELDQAHVSYAIKGTTTKVGRQAITLDNQRFVGDVGWRQNHQTYDAATFRSTDIERLTLFYGFVDNVVRIFGSEAPKTGANAGEAESSSHLVNASYRAGEALTLTAYGYLLDLGDVPASLSSDTYGARVKGSVPLMQEGKAGYQVEYANQRDGGDNPHDYTADYVHLAVDGACRGLMAQAGFEALGADKTGATDADGAPVFASFQTPLATLHKFNGFADRFLVTPAKGLEDRYLMVGYTFALPAAVGPLDAQLWVHDFETEAGGEDLGDEWDAVLIKPLKLDPIPGKVTALAKYASYRAGDTGADTDRFSVELDYSIAF